MVKSSLLQRATVHAILIVGTFVVLFPLYWTFITGFKDIFTASSMPTFIPFVDFKPSLDAYDTLVSLHLEEFIRYFRNSLISSIGGAALATGIGSLGAYALSRFTYRRWKNDDIAFWFMSQKMFPPIAMLLPFYVLFQNLRMLDTLPTLMLVYCVLNLPIAVWILRDFFAEIPIEVQEAAMVDGASTLQTFLRVVLPLAAPGIAVTAIICFVFSWNEFLLTLTLTFVDAKTLPVQLAGITTSQRGIMWNEISFRAMIVLLPPIILVAAIQKYLVKGLSFGAVKG